MADSVTRAHRELERAEQAIATAERTRDEARDQLEAALAAVGWTRLRGAFFPGATPLYVNSLYPGATIEVNRVIEVLEQQRRAAA